MSQDPDAVLATLKPWTYVFYLDIADNSVLPKVVKYIQLNGGQCSPFLDKNVTHLVTDKAKTMADVYPIAQKWNITVWSVEQFATIFLKYMHSKGLKVTSPTLHRVISRKRDLSQFLEEEKRHQSKPVKSTAPQFPLTRTSQAAVPSEANFSFSPFETHYVMIEDAEGTHCPIFKEYSTQPLQGTSEQAFKVPRMAFPMFYWDSPIGQCPFIPPLATPQAQATKSQQSQTRAASEKKENVAIAANVNQEPETNKKAGGPELVPGTAELRARLLRNSRMKQANPDLGAHEIHRFDPVMTDSTIMTAKSVLFPNARGQAPAVGVNGIKISPHISVNVNRAATSTPKHPVLAVRAQSAKVKSSTTPTGVEDSSQTKRRKAAANGHAHHRPRPGFCECCGEKYSDLEKHVKTNYHRVYAVQNGNYEGIDVFLSTLKRSFAPEFLKNVNKPFSFGDSEASTAPIPQQSPVSPSTAHSAHAPAARNYTGSKKARQSALDTLRYKTWTGDSPSMAEEELGQLNQFSSPSCKRRKSQRAH